MAVLITLTRLHGFKVHHLSFQLGRPAYPVVLCLYSIRRRQSHNLRTLIMYCLLYQGANRSFIPSMWRIMSPHVPRTASHAEPLDLALTTQVANPHSAMVLGFPGAACDQN